MTIAQTAEPAPRKPLRLWPGVAAAVLLCLARFGLPIVMQEGFAYAILGGFVFGLAIVVWWAFFSRAPWPERWGYLLLMIAALAATSRIIHISIATGMMGMMFPIYAFPVASLALVVGAVAGRRLSDGARRATMIAAILLGCGVLALFRTNGISLAGSDFAWRWAKTAEDRLLARPIEEPAPLPVAPVAAIPKAVPAAIPKAAPALLPVPAETGAGWPGFRGPHRDGVVHGVRIETDWSASPPVQMWRRPIGPGWSSFAVQGNLLYTQEQRGSDEIVACYNAATGKPVWTHRDLARFWESNAGAGPRATPTLSNGRVYTFGATGIVNALDATSGAVVWSRNATSDTGVKAPGWGFASSPLVVDDVVVVAAAGKLVGYDISTGKPRWFGPNGGDGYSSPQLFTIDGVPQILLMSAHGATSVAPADGTVLWEHAWPSDTRIVQPAITSDGDVLMIAMTAAGGTGIRRVAVSHGPGGWAVAERWTSPGLKPYFNDFVVNDGHAFGFDGSILACIDLKDGQRKWKGGRYGNGQLMLLPDQNLLLVLSEDGELALVAAEADQFKEIARFPAIEGKTWNHPALAGDVLLVRNGQEMAAFRLPLARR
jgi:outer membrane protein assembly factor BamB/multidrug transporter EmrE-like cation transporter